MLKKSIFIIILLQLLGLLEACCGGGVFESQIVRLDLIARDISNKFEITIQDSVDYQNLNLELQFTDSLKRIAAIQTGIMPTAYALTCVPDDIRPLRNIQKIVITTLNDLGNHVSAMSDITNLFTSDSMPIDTARLFFNQEQLGQRRNFMYVRFQPPFLVRQICKFRIEVTFSDGFILRKETGDLKLI